MSVRGLAFATPSTERTRCARAYKVPNTPMGHNAMTITPRGRSRCPLLRRRPRRLPPWLSPYPS
eukprot:1263734-Lingulodinium_polyedra.AAC.1